MADYFSLVMHDADQLLVGIEFDEEQICLNLHNTTDFGHELTIGEIKISLTANQVTKILRWWPSSRLKPVQST